MFHFVEEICVCLCVEIFFFILIIRGIVFLHFRFDVIVLFFIVDLIHSKCSRFSHPADVLAENMFRHLRIKLGDV